MVREAVLRLKEVIFACWARFRTMLASVAFSGPSTSLKWLITLVKALCIPSLRSVTLSVVVEGHNGV
jgi:hypothetical protein